VGETADAGLVARAAERLGADLAAEDGFFILHKLAPTPDGFPRRTGVARKRPLA
jgi:hypothetical protein